MNDFDISALSKEELLELLNMLGRNLLSVDGLWFIYVEDKFGLEKAVEIDEKVWDSFGLTEGLRLKKARNITGDGISSLVEVLPHLSWFATCDYEISEVTDERLVLSITNCSPQKARIRTGRGEFSCRQVGINYFGAILSTIAPSLKVSCLLTPPEEHPDNLWCQWEFRLE
jgi:hypothetical protein